MRLSEPFNPQVLPFFFTDDACSQPLSVCLFATMETLAFTTTGKREIPELHDTKARILRALSRMFDLTIDITTKYALLTAKLRRLRQTVQDSGTTEPLDEEAFRVAQPLALYKRLGSEIRCTTGVLMSSMRADCLYLYVWLKENPWALSIDIHQTITYMHNLEIVMAVDKNLRRAEKKLETVRHAIEKGEQGSTRIQAPYELARGDCQPAPSDQARISSTTEDHERDSVILTWLDKCMAEN